ncbi:hypothetical protein GYMLUDRAFT_65338 [Collybiopsis luxurians FD-317 M1]|uniref:Uncharacterized protein n=1 Tax=Collybiopsis luxurians FD-317 M1 TaxID=944289 RepID=A0A0D0BLM2_9AGAR|nr:hypothetical protein GYMLUDRAFT_65338 [Collybiopsis luxurians FD-317 M1]
MPLFATVTCSSPSSQCLPPSPNSRPSPSPAPSPIRPPSPSVSDETIRPGNIENIAEILPRTLPQCTEAEDSNSIRGNHIDATLEPVDMVNIRPMTIITTRNRVMSYRDYEKFVRGFRDRDSEDSELKSSIRTSDDGKYFVVPVDRKVKYLSGQLSLTIIPPAQLPAFFDGIKCYAIGLRHLLPNSVGPGTLIPAGAQNRRAMVLAHFHQQNRFHYVLCLHGLSEVFLLRVHEFGMTQEWTHWDDAASAYRETAFGPIFSAGGQTLSERTAGVRDFQAMFLRHARGDYEQDQVEEASRSFLQRFCS